MNEQANGGMLAAYGITDCGCYECVEAVISARPFPDNMMYPFVICDTCGNKRCPRAQSHLNVCTGSNESGQPGATRYRNYTDAERAVLLAAFRADLEAEADSNA